MRSFYKNIDLETQGTVLCVLALKRNNFHQTVSAVWCFVPAKAARGLQQFRKQFPPPIRERRFPAYNKCTEMLPILQIPVLRISGAEKVKTSTKVPENMEKRATRKPLSFVFYLFNYSASKASFSSPHTGQTQSAGTSSHFVPGATPLSGSPFAGSYS